MTGVYKFTDNKGVVHYVDSIEKVPKKYRKRARHPTGGAVSIVPSTSIDEILYKHGITEEQFRRYTGKKPSTKRGSHKKVIIYTTSWCPACTRARKYLDSRGVSYTEKDVEHNKSNLTEMLQKSGGARGVPVIDIHGKIMRGFSQAAIDRELGK
jgi:glutaredoxin-like YruB-family protein